MNFGASKLLLTPMPPHPGLWSLSPAHMEGDLEDGGNRVAYK